MLALSSREGVASRELEGLVVAIEHRTYFRERAEQEMAAAANAADPSIGAIHADLAKLHMVKAEGPIEAGGAATLEALLVEAFSADADNFRRSRQSERA